MSRTLQIPRRVICGCCGVVSSYPHYRKIAVEDDWDNTRPPSLVYSSDHEDLESCDSVSDELDEICSDDGFGGRRTSIRSSSSLRSQWPSLRRSASPSEYDICDYPVQRTKRGQNRILPSSSLDKANYHARATPRDASSSSERSALPGPGYTDCRPLSNYTFEDNNNSIYAESLEGRLVAIELQKAQTLQERYENTNNHVRIEHDSESIKETIKELRKKFRHKYKPMCRSFCLYPPRDSKSFERKRSYLIMELDRMLDDIPSDKIHDPALRIKRKELTKRVQAYLKELDYM